jgi:hypothetical protein
MIHPIRVNHTKFLQLAIKTHSFIVKQTVRRKSNSSTDRCRLSSGVHVLTGPRPESDRHFLEVFFEDFQKIRPPTSKNVPTLAPVGDRWLLLSRFRVGGPPGVIGANGPAATSWHPNLGATSPDDKRSPTSIFGSDIRFCPTLDHPSNGWGPVPPN